MTNTSKTLLNDDLKKFSGPDFKNHVAGKSIYIDDIPVVEGMIYIKIFDSTVAHGKIQHLDFSEAEEVEGIVKIFSYKDITGENQIGGIIPDEPLLAEEEVHFCGQPILLIAAESEDAAEEAFHKMFHMKNPNAGLLKELQDAGVKFIACGQAMGFLEVPKQSLSADIKLALTANVILSSYQRQGFVLFNEEVEN